MRADGGIALLADPLAELRAEIEEIAADNSDPQTRAVRLAAFRVDLTDLLGLIDTYAGDLAEEKRAVEATPVTVLKLRENADIRDRLIEMGEASPEMCDDVLLWSHDELDKLAEEGLLEEAAAHVGAFMSALRKFDPKKHPRGRGGRFSEVFNKISSAKQDVSTPLGPGVQVYRSGGKTHVQYRHRTVSTHTNVENAARSAAALLDRPPGRRRDREPAPTGEPRQGLKASTAERARERGIEAVKTPEKRETPEERRARLWQERRKALEERVGRTVSGAAEAGRLTDAESHFNDAGKVSQRTLSAYVDEAATQPQTIDKYSSVNSNGDRVWEQSRRELHERIITAFLKKRRIDAEGKEVLDYSTGAEDLQPHPDGPQVLFSGGGYAAGKGQVLKLLAARGDLPPDSFTLDPDKIKAELPEFQQMIGSDPEANMHVYQEAWAISQEIQARAMDRKLNIVVDGISDTSPEEMGERARAFTDRGYKARAVYVDIPTEEAMRRAADRATKAKSDSDRRMIPEIIMRSVHRDVAATVPSLPAYLRDNQIPLDIEIYDNDQGKDETTGTFRPPKPFYSFAFESGEEQVLDQPLMDRFRKKAYETILHVDAPQ